MSAKCENCGKTAYPLESVNASGKTYHKGCFKCSVCSLTLNLKNFKLVEAKLYCGPHTPANKASGSAAMYSVSMKTALNAPKKDIQKGIHKADPKVAPAKSNDFAVNQVGDQSTENNPESSNIQYDQHHGDQSTENNPESSNIQYDQHHADQSTENNPESSNVQYEQYQADQSTEYNPEQQQQEYQ